MNTHEWGAHTIHVHARALPQYLWLFSSFEVVVDQRQRYRGSYSLRVKDVIEFELDHRGATVQGKLCTKRVSIMLYVPYDLIINNQRVGGYRVRPDNWYVACLPMGLIAVLLYVMTTWLFVYFVMG